MSETAKDGRASLAGRPVRIHFEVTNGALYSFWISRDDTGRSDGYIAGGGPGYDGPTDTVGHAALLTPAELKPISQREAGYLIP